MHEVAHSYADDRLKEQLKQLRAKNDAREELLREEIAKWKSHREWSDRILAAYLVLLAERGQ